MQTEQKRKRRRSDPVLWQKPLHQQKCQKGKVTQTTPQKSSIKQQLRTDLGRSVGVTTATQLTFPIFNFSETNESFLMKLNRKQVFNSSTKFLFCADLSKEIATVASVWMKQFGVLLFNYWKRTGDEFSTSSSKCLIAGGSVNKHGYSDNWLAYTFSTPICGFRLLLQGFRQCN